MAVADTAVVIVDNVSAMITGVLVTLMNPEIARIEYAHSSCLG